jgi:hypothetical protein
MTTLSIVYQNRRASPPIGRILCHIRYCLAATDPTRNGVTSLCQDLKANSRNPEPVVVANPTGVGTRYWGLGPHQHANEWRRSPKRENGLRGAFSTRGYRIIGFSEQSVAPLCSIRWNRTNPELPVPFLLQYLPTYGTKAHRLQCPQLPADHHPDVIAD